MSRPSLSSAWLESVPVDRFVGTWEGIYYIYPTAMALTVSIRSTGSGNVEGEVHARPLLEERRASGIEGRFAVRGVYDPLTGAFELIPTSWIEQPRQAVTAGRLEGVFDAERPALAGLLLFGPARQDMPRSYFVLTQPDQVRSLTRPMADATQKSVSRLPRIGRGGPSDETLVRRAARFRQEHPRVDPYRTEMSRLFALAVNLFEDQHFRAHFGKTFDQMGAGERRAVYHAFSGRNDELRQYSSIARAFGTTGTQGTPETMHAVLALRVIRSWQATQHARLEAMRPTRRTFEKLARVERDRRVASEQTSC